MKKLVFGLGLLVMTPLPAPANSATASWRQPPPNPRIVTQPATMVPVTPALAGRSKQVPLSSTASGKAPSVDLQGPLNEKWRQACGTALVPLPSSGLHLTGEVHVSLSRIAATRFLHRGERFLDVPVNPKYFAYDRFGILVHDGSSLQRWSAVAPPGMKVQPGDSVTIVTRHQDDSLPCHFVPNLVIAVRHKKA